MRRDWTPQGVLRGSVVRSLRRHRQRRSRQRLQRADPAFIPEGCAVVRVEARETEVPDWTRLTASGYNAASEQTFRPVTKSGSTTVQSVSSDKAARIPFTPLAVTSPAALFSSPNAEPTTFCLRRLTTCRTGLFDCMAKPVDAAGGIATCRLASCRGRVQVRVLMQSPLSGHRSRFTGAFEAEAGTVSAFTGGAGRI